MPKTQQQIADELNSLRSQAVNIVSGTIASAANPGGSITFTYVNPIDHQPYTATGTAWNQCSPSKVSALKQLDGSWIVIGQHESAIVREAVHTDRRARSQPETGGKVKTLHSRIEGDERVFYLWGDRARPKRIFAITKDSRMLIAKINNLGGDKWIVGLQWESTTEYATNNFVFAAVIYTQVFSDSQVWNKTNAIGQRGSDASLPSRSFVEPTLKYMGYGFWIVNKYPYSDGDTGFIGQPTIYTFYQGEVRTPTVVPVSLTETRTEGLIVPSLFGNKQGHYWYYPSASYSAIREYKFTPNFQIPDDAGFPFSMIYANDRANFIVNYSGGGQINGNRYCNVRNLYSSVYSSTTNRWDIDIYTIAETTTKTSIKTKVTCKLNPSTDFLYSASYHP